MPQELTNGPIVVVVAHPDDEVIGVGGQLGRWTQDVVLVHATDGSPRSLADARRAGFDTAEKYAAARHAELHSALSLLPRPPAARVRLGAMDQGVVLDLDSVRQALRALIEHAGPSAVMTHPYEGGHPDHDALAYVIARLHDDLPAFRHLEFACYHAANDGTLATNRFTIPDTPAERVVLTPNESRRKRQMLDAFRTQAATLQPFGVKEEWWRPAPVYDFTRPPNDGCIWYDRFHWDITSTEWLRLVRADLARTGAGTRTC